MRWSLYLNMGTPALESLPFTILLDSRRLKRFWLTLSIPAPKSRMQRPEKEVLVPYCRVTDNSVPTAPCPPPLQLLTFRTQQTLGVENYCHPAFQPELNRFSGKALASGSRERKNSESSPYRTRSSWHLICTKQNCRFHLVLYQRQKLWQQRHTIVSQACIPSHMLDHGHTGWGYAPEPDFQALLMKGWNCQHPSGQWGSVSSLHNPLLASAVPGQTFLCVIRSRK